MQRSHGALAEHEFDLSNFARILHDSAFEVAAGGHDDALGRGQRPEARQRLYIAVPPGLIAARGKNSGRHGLIPSASPRLRVNQIKDSRGDAERSEEHTSELPSLMRTLYAA